MKKKVMSAVLAAAMVVGMAGNVVTVSAKGKNMILPYIASTPQTRILRTGLQMWKMPRA